MHWATQQHHTHLPIEGRDPSHVRKAAEEGLVEGGRPERAANRPEPQGTPRLRVLDTLECGIVLVGSEVKSLRGGKVSLDESYGRIKDGEVWLVGCDIAEYAEANRFNHLPSRPRKLLLHRREIQRFADRGLQQGLTLVPLKMYFKQAGPRSSWASAAAGKATTNARP